MNKKSDYRLVIALTVLFAAFAPIDPAWANCGLRVNASSVSLAWNQNFTFQPVTFTVTKTKGGHCTAYITFSKGSAPSYASRQLTYLSQTLSYQLYKEPALTHILKDVPDVTTINDVIVLNFPNNANVTLTGTYYIQLPPLTNLKPPGVYQDTFDIRAFDSTSLTTPEASAPVTLATTMPRMIDLSIVNTGQSFDPGSTQKSLNFGTLTAGETLGLDLIIRSNVGYSVSFSSQNDGRFRNANPQITTRIPYSLRVDAASKSLAGSASSPVLVAGGAGQTQPGGKLHAVQFKVGNTENSMAGNYSDYITVTATSNE